MTDSGFSSWQFFMRFGATPHFKYAGISAFSQYGLPQKDESALWQASLKVMQQLAHNNERLKNWLQSAEGIYSSQINHDTFAVWLRALMKSTGLPDYPVQVSYGIDGTMRTDSACPYEVFTRLAVQLTGELLNWSHAVLSMKQLRLQGQQLQSWLQAIFSLPALLPTNEVMSFHRDLWERGINWQWLGGEQTRVGQGVNQRVLHYVESISVGETNTLRIPIYTVTGSVGKTTTARLLAQLLRNSGKLLALAASDGAWVGEERILEGDCIGGVTANALLKRTEIEAAVFEQGRGGIIKQGIPYPYSDVAVLLNVQAVHVGLDNINTIEEMAEVKAVGIYPAHLAILNMDDDQCCRIGKQRTPESCVWFSVTATPDTLQSVSQNNTGSLGVERNEQGTPQALLIWQAGQVIKNLSLKNVTPYHGLLGQKTLEELLAAVGAAWFGPLPLPDWDNLLPKLRLDNSNHLFRTSVHHQGEVVFVLDKAGEKASLVALEEAIESICRKEEIIHRIAVLCRAAGEHPDRHRESCVQLHRFMDEFICFDRPDTYKSKVALPIYRPGSIPRLLEEEFLRLNVQHQVKKPVTICDGWNSVEKFLHERFSAIKGKTLVLLNQPSTGVIELNKSIVEFVSNQRCSP